MLGSADKENNKPTKHQSTRLKGNMKFLLPIVLVLLPATWTRADSVAIDIFQLINQRLSYMQYVALSKATAHSTVENRDRERQVLEKAKTESDELGLDAESMLLFIQAQMDVAKAIQYRYLADWLVTKPSNIKPKDLDLEVRPQLLQIDKEIFVKLK